MPDNIYAVAARFKRALIAREGAAAREVRRYYRQAERRIAKRLEKVIGELEQWQREHPDEKDPPVWWVFERDRLQALQAQAEQELARFAERATERIEAEQRRLTAQAEANAEALARAGLGPPPPGVTVTWARLPKGAIEQLVGTLQDGSPLRDLLDVLGLAASETIRRELVNGLALGENPRTVARRIREALNGNRVRAETIARTEMLRSYRESSRASYLANSDVVKGWVWHAAADERTCEMCWAMHGTEHALEEHLDDHPRGRCAMLPLTRTWKELGFDVPETRAEVESGESLFARLSEEQQRAILGDAKYEAYKAGAIKLSDVVGRKSDPRWGTMRYARSLKEILGAEGARKWRATGVLSLPRSGGAAVPPAGTPPLAAGGLTPVERAVRQIEQQIKRDALESLHAVDAQGATVFTKGGQRDSVRLTDAEIAGLKDLVVTHNHPGGLAYPLSDPRSIGNSFSPADIAATCRAQAAEIRAVTPTCTFIMRRPAAGWDGQYWATTLEPCYNKHEQAVRAEFRRAVWVTHTMPLENAEALHFHEVWKRVAKELGLDYGVEYG